MRAVSGVVHPDTPATHVVQNQASLLEDFSTYGRDTALQEAIAAHGAQWAEPQLQQYGKVLGSAEWLEHATLANENKPVLHTHDRHGNRVDVAKFHPSYHAVLGGAIEHAVHALPYLNDRRSGSNVARAAMVRRRRSARPARIAARLLAQIRGGGLRGAGRWPLTSRVPVFSCTCTSRPRAGPHARCQ